MQNKRNLYIALGLAGLAIVILIIGLTYKNWGGGTTPGGETPAEKTDAPAGKLTESFPLEILVESNLMIRESYSLKTADENRAVVNYYSRFSIAENLRLYRDRLKTLGYTITKDENFGSDTYNIEAERQYERVNIVIIQSDPKIQPNVVVLYSKS